MYVVTCNVHLEQYTGLIFVCVHNIVTEHKKAGIYFEMLSIYQVTNGVIINDNTEYTILNNIGYKNNLEMLSSHHRSVSLFKMNITIIIMQMKMKL